MTTPRMSARRHAVFHPLRVAEVDRLTDDSVAITFDVPAELREEYHFTQGQHVAIMCDLGGSGVRRNYSICSPAPSGSLRIGVKRLPDGAFSSYAAERLRPGDVLDVMTPSGRFFTRLDPANTKHYAAIAAGSGITPVLSLLATTLQVEPASQVTLLYGNRTTSSIMFLEELQDLKNRYPDRFCLLNFLSREPQESDLLSGRIDRQRLTRLLALLLPPDDVDEWFLCGPLGMVQQGRLALADAGVPSERIHTELFHVGALPPAAPDSRPPAEAAGGAALSPSSSTAGRRRWSSPAARSQSSRPCCGSARTHRTPAKAGCVVPAGPGWSRARPTWSGTSRSSRTRS